MMSKSLTAVFFLFVLQIMFFLFYMQSFDNATRKDTWKNSSAVRWLVGVLVCNLTFKDQAGHTFQHKFWLKVICNHKEMEGHWDDEDTNLASGRVSYGRQAKLCMLMSFCVNMIIRETVFFSAPLLLGVSEEALDFFKYALAVLFLTKLDDIANPINFLEDMKMAAARRNKASENYYCSCLWLYETGDPPDETDAKIVAMERRMEASEMRMEAYEKRMEAYEKRIQELEQK